MGLFSAVLHIRDVPGERVVAVLVELLRTRGFELDQDRAVPETGPRALLPARATADAHYLVADLHPWTIVIEAQFVEGVPLAGLGADLSRALDSYALTLNVHDDDLFLYDLDKSGKSLDGYNSCPQYFESDPLSEDFIESQRHTPEEFLPLLNSEHELAALRALLARGWWSAHDSGRLDENGVVLDDDRDDSFVFEGDRMTAFGTLLGLHGAQGEYPYAGWLDDDAKIQWRRFRSLTFLSHRS